jgi:putative chitinase
VIITKEQLKSAIPGLKQSKIDLYFEPFNKTMEKYGINTPKRITCFLAQIGHESCSFVFVKELASGMAYEGRRDLGNVVEGDGVKFKGRGLIQITGRSNYFNLGEDLDLDLIGNPELLEEPMNATMSAGWFWNKHNLNALADKDKFLDITKRINGGTNGLEDRMKRWETAKKALL